MPDNKQSPTFRGPATQMGTGRQEIGTIPSAASQKNWSYAMVRDKGDKRILRLDGGKGRSFAFRFDSGLSKDDVAAGRPVTVTRLSDSVPHDPDGSEVMSKGSVQVHKSSPTLIHATFHDGKGGSTLMFEQGKDGGWSVKPGKKRSLADMTARFVSVMGKQASVCCPCCGVTPGKYKIQGDAISCGDCGKTSDMEKWEKQADGSTLIAGAGLGGLAGGLYGALSAEPGERFSKAMRWGLRGTVAGGLLGGATSLMASRGTDSPFSPPADPKETAKFDALRRDRNYAAKDIMDRGETSPRQINDIQFGPGDLDRRIAAASAYRARHPELKYLQKLDKFDQKVPIKPATLPEGNYGVTTFSYPSGVLDRLAGVFSRVKPKELPEGVKVDIDLPQVAAARTNGSSEAMFEPELFDVVAHEVKGHVPQQNTLEDQKAPYPWTAALKSLDAFGKDEGANLRYLLKPSELERTIQASRDWYRDTFSKIPDSLEEVVGALNGEVKKIQDGVKSTNRPSGDALRLPYIQRSTTPSDWSKIMNQASQIFPGVVMNGGTTSKVAIEGAILEQPNAMTSANIARHEGAQKPIRSLQGVDSLGGPGTWPTPAPGARTGMRRGKLPTGNTSTATTPQPRFISTTPLKSLNSAMPAITQLMKTAAGTWRRPENFDQLSDNGLNDSSYVVYVGANDWECGVTWAAVYRQKDVNQSGVSGATPRVWVEIDHDDCPGCEGGEYSPGGTVGKNKCNDFGRKVVRRWVRESMQGGSGSLEDRLYRAARMDSDVKAYGRAAQKSAAPNQGEFAHGYPVISPEDAGVGEFLQKNPHVAGMAWGGGENGSDATLPRSIVVNPHNQFMGDATKRSGLMKIEAARHLMGEEKYVPTFSLVPEQQAWRKKLGDSYATNDEAFKQSIVSRLMAGDEVPSATPEQIAAADEWNKKLDARAHGHAAQKSAVHRCPFCGSDDTYTRTAHEETEMEERQVRCKMCHKSAPLDECMTTKTAGVGSYLKILRDKFVAARDRVHLTPTKPQQDAGNYRKGHVWMQGLDVTIENPKGSTRSGKRPDGTTWKSTMAADYGDIRNYPRSKADGDNMDIFVGPHPTSEVVYVIDQYVGGKFDEHKCMCGFFTLKEAKQAYQDSFDDQWKGFGGVTTMTMSQFKQWLDDGDTSKPLVGQSLHKIIKKTAVVDNSYLPPLVASAFDSPMVRNPALAVGSGALRGATIAALIHGLRTMKRETLDEPKKDLNLTRDLGLGAAIGAGSGALLHYAPEITSFVHEAFNPSMPKEAHIMDIPMLPFSVAAPAAPLVGAAYGSILGGLKGMATRLKKKITGEPEEEGEVEDSILNGVQGGLNIGVGAAMGGRNVHTDKLTGIAPPPAPPAGVRGKGKVPPRPAKPVATPSINRYVIPRTR